MKVALYEEGRFWDEPDFKGVFSSVDAARGAIPEGFEITDISGRFYDLYAEDALLERWATIKEFEVIK